MNQRTLDEDQEAEKKKVGEYEEHFRATRTTSTGFDYNFTPKNTLHDSLEEREKFYRDLLVTQGGFRCWLGTYKDLLLDQKANDEAYKFWRDETRKRIEAKKAELPDQTPTPLGTKRPSLEQNYYEVVSQANVDIIDVNEDPIQDVSATSLRTKQGTVEVDIIILATGFDSVLGSLGQLNIQDVKG